MKRKTALLISTILVFWLAACGADHNGGNQNNVQNTPAVSSEPPVEIIPAEGKEEASEENDTETVEEEAGLSYGESITNARLPDKLSEIPQQYFTGSGHQGTLVEMEYDTYESMSYEQQTKVLHKRAIVYLPYGYSEDTRYNVFYLMHGGWSDETAYLGTPDQPGAFKNVLDHAIEDGKIRPVIVVCPTYNNESEKDSWDYSLAIRLTDNYHNELVKDLIPAVEGTYSTYAEDTTLDGIRRSRDHRAFCGFSMGSVATWRTFRYADHESEGNLYFLEQEGGTHSGEYAMEYFYNGLCWIWH